MSSNSLLTRDSASRGPSFDPVTLAPRRTIPGPAPSGWSYVRLTRAQELGTWLADVSAATALAAARSLSRRTFLRRAAMGAAALGAGITGVLWDPRSARGYDPCGPNLPYGCGPSEICDDEQCNSSGNCKLSNPAIERRAKPDDTYPGNYCAAPGAWNYWYECCSGKEKFCADCCVGGCGSCGSCSGCTSKKKCICRSTSGSC